MAIELFQRLGDFSEKREEYRKVALALFVSVRAYLHLSVLSELSTDVPTASITNRPARKSSLTRRCIRTGTEGTRSGPWERVRDCRVREAEKSWWGQVLV